MTKNAVATARIYYTWSDGTKRGNPQLANLVQKTVKDPATGKLDSFFNIHGANTTTPPTSDVSQAGYISGNVNGNDLIAICFMANDFGTGPDPAGNNTIACQDPVNGSWSSVIRQLNNGNDCNTDAHIWIKRAAAPLLSTSWSGTGAVSSSGVLTIGSGTGTFRLGQRVNSATITSAHPVTVAGGETIVVSLLSGTLGVSGSTYQLNDGIGSTTFSSEAMTTTDIVAVQRTIRTSPVQADYPGIILLELSGTDGANIYSAGANPVAGGAGTDTLSSGVLSGLPTKGGLMIGVGFNGGANGSPIAPEAGSAFAGGTIQKLLSFDLGQAIATLVIQHVPSLAAQGEMKWSPHGASNYLTIAVALPDAA